jgi:anthranilate 1,2-dioxygenase large subunit
MRHVFDIRTHNLADVNAKPSRELVSVMAKQQTIPKQSLKQAWPAEGLTRVPYRVFQTEESYRTEQLRIFHGPT